METNIKELNESKAEGNDEITNAMIKNLPDNAKLILMEIYNNILLSGCVPEDWKAGDWGGYSGMSCPRTYYSVFKVCRQHSSPLRVVVRHDVASPHPGEMVC